MITTVLLWAVVLLYSFLLAGYLHNRTVNIPNWSSGSVEDMNRYRNFYHKSGNARYFAPVIFSTILMSLVALIGVWPGTGRTRFLVGSDLLIAIGLLASVLLLFRPINRYFEAGEYEPLRLKILVQRWLFYNDIRFFFVVAGLILAIAALDAHRW